MSQPCVSAPDERSYFSGSVKAESPLSCTLGASRDSPVCRNTHTQFQGQAQLSQKRVCVWVRAWYRRISAHCQQRVGGRERGKGRKRTPPPPPQITILITEGRLREGEKEKSSKNCFCTSRRKFNDILKLIVFLFTSVPSSTDSTLIWF